jgi:hypothetical protein
MQRQKGVLTENQIQSQLTGRKDRIKHCYTQFLKRVPQTSLTLEGRFYVTSTGALTAVGLYFPPSSTPPPSTQRYLKPLKHCLFKSVEGLRFPKPTLPSPSPLSTSSSLSSKREIPNHLQGNTFTYPFRFTP